MKSSCLSLATFQKECIRYLLDTKGKAQFRKPKCFVHQINNSLFCSQLFPVLKVLQRLINVQFLFTLIASISMHSTFPYIDISRQVQTFLNSAVGRILGRKVFRHHSLTKKPLRSTESDLKNGITSSPLSWCHQMRNQAQATMPTIEKEKQCETKN